MTPAYQPFSQRLASKVERNAEGAGSVHGAHGRREQRDARLPANLPSGSRPAMVRAVVVSPFSDYNPPRTTCSLALGLAASATLLASVACNPRPQACWAPRDCGTGYECLAHVCTPNGGEPVDAQTQRKTLAPTQLQPLGHQSRLLPEVRLGGSRPGAQALYVRFELPELQSQQVARAFLLLAPDELAMPPQRPVELRARTLHDDWTPRDIQRGAVPSAARDSVRARVAGVSPARFDVTAWVRRWLKSPERNHGVVIDGLDDAYGYTVALDHTLSPRLDIYWRASLASGSAER